MSGIPPGGDRRNPKRVDRRSNPALSGQLELLARMSGHLAVTLNIEDTIQKALELIANYVNAEAGSLFLLENDDAALICRASVGPVDVCGLTLKPDEGIVGHCVTANDSRMVRDVSEDPDFAQSVDKATGFHTRSILCTPMTVQDTCIGAIELLNKKDEERLFSEPDLMMLKTLASAAALAIRNAKMAEELVEQERVSRELELANEMQRSLLPDTRPAPFPIHGINLPAHEVSGDFYDFYELEDGRIYFSLGDVSGKGMDAALLMSKTASLFRCLGKTIDEPAALLATINRELCETAIHGMFVTMVCGILDPATGDIKLANAGHEPPLIHDTSDNFIPIAASAPPLGILPLDIENLDIRDESFNLAGGTLYVFTDGVTEGELGGGRRLEVEGFMDTIRTHASAPAAARIDAVINRLRRSGRKRHDDITLIAVEDTAAQQADTDNTPLTSIASLTFPAHADELRSVRDAVRQACQACDCPAAVTQDLVIAVGEATQNIVRHAYRDGDNGQATLEILCGKGILEFLLQDTATPINRDILKPAWPEEVRPGGIGLCLIHDIMDEVEYLPVSSGQGNLLRMAKYFERDNNET
ncbi:MAG: SpoIIE family protein phosphatase [Pseudomonadota bacterium]